MLVNGIFPCCSRNSDHGICALHAELLIQSRRTDCGRVSLYLDDVPGYLLRTLCELQKLRLVLLVQRGLAVAEQHRYLVHDVVFAQLAKALVVCCDGCLIGGNLLILCTELSLLRCERGLILLLVCRRLGLNRLQASLRIFAPPSSHCL